MLTAARDLSTETAPHATDPLTAFEQELPEIMPGLRRRAHMLESNGWSAEDLLQDTLERALSRRNHLRPGSNLAAWLGVIMKNLFVDRCRQERTRSTAHLSLTLMGSAPAECSPEAPWESMVVADLAHLVGRLQTPLRETVELVLLGRCSYRAAAARLGVPVATIGTRLNRARRKLRALVAASASGFRPETEALASST
jgi:RNA polymerase sigma-70 factor, ECF subfamily